MTHPAPPLALPTQLFREREREINNSINIMKFRICRTATAAVAATLLATTIPQSGAFARPSSGLSRASSGVVNHVALLSLSRLPRGGGASSAGICSSMGMSTETVNEIITVTTAPIEGMRPGTSGLRKKVEVWMGEHYVENFIQSLIDTAAAANGGKMLDT
jgi:hypothetical protein